MKTRLAILFGAGLLVTGCAVGPDYGYGYGYASNDYGSCAGSCSDGYGPSSYGTGPSFGLDLNFSDRDRDHGDRDRHAEVFHQGEAARAGGAGERRDSQVGRAAPQARQEGGDRGHDRGHEEGRDQGNDH